MPLLQMAIARSAPRVFFLMACFWECVCVCASGPLSSSLVFQPWPLKMKEVNSPLVLHLTAFWRVCVDRPNS